MFRMYLPAEFNQGFDEGLKKCPGRAGAVLLLCEKFLCKAAGVSAACDKAFFLCFGNNFIQKFFGSKKVIGVQFVFQKVF